MGAAWERRGMCELAFTRPFGKQFTLPSKITIVGVTDGRRAEKDLENVKITEGNSFSELHALISGLRALRNSLKSKILALTAEKKNKKEHKMALISEFSISPITLFPIVLQCISPQCWIYALTLSPCNTLMS
jgi:hypothetical protein